VEGGHDHPIGRRELRPIDLPTQDSELMAQKQQLRLRVMESQLFIRDVEQDAKA
jgi:hypothetical protein